MIETSIETGPGGRQAYLDLGDARIIVRQLTGIKSDALDAPNIIQSHSVEGNALEIAIIVELFQKAIELATEWGKDIGTEWKEPIVKEP